MITKRTIFVSIIIVLSLLFIVISTLVCFFVFAPLYIESKLIPKIAQENGIDTISMKIQNIGISTIDIKDIRIGNGQQEGLNLDSIKIKYSLLGLLNRQIKNIALSGISLNLAYEKNQISVTGLEGLLKNDKNKSEKDDSSSAPFTIKKLLVSNSTVHLKVNDKKLSIPFNLSTTSFNQYMLPEEFILGIYPSGHEITAEGKIGINKKTNVNLKTKDLPLDIFKDIIGEEISLDIKGLADINLSAKLSSNPISITNIFASFMLKESIIDFQDFILRTPYNNDPPANIMFESKDLEHWEYSVSNLLLDNKSAPVMIKLSGSADIFEKIQKGKIQAITQIMSGDTPPELIWDISAIRESNSDIIKVKINGKQDILGDDRTLFKVQFRDMLFKGLSPEINTQAEYNKDLISGSYIISAKNIESALNEMDFSTSKLSIQGNVTLPQDDPKKYASNYTILFKDIAFKGFDISMNFPDYQINGTMQYNIEKNFDTDARITFKNGSLSMLENSLKAKTISGDIPIHWPLNKGHQKGHLSIKKITYGKYLLGPINIDISQKGNNLPFSGSALFHLLPDMAINISGSIVVDPLLDVVKINVDVPLFKPASMVDLGKFLPELVGYQYDGFFYSNSTVSYSNSGILSDLNLSIDNGTIENSEMNLNLENISLKLKLDDLINVISPSGQRLKIDKITFNKILANDAIVDFKLNGPSSLLIEHGSFKWCDGDINIPSFKIVPGKDDYDLTLLCDRLDLTKVLAQLGAVNATGEGALDGKIPLHYSKGHIIFKNGFLSSIPGQGGKIQIKNTEILTNALNQETKESTQIEIVSEALKDFIYDSVKIDLNSDGDKLKMQLHLNGKPVNNLPFEYSKNLGRFIRVDSSKNGSTFKGFGIDLNFSIPFDELLNYGEALDMIE